MDQKELKGILANFLAAVREEDVKIVLEKIEGPTASLLSFNVECLKGYQNKPSSVCRVKVCYSTENGVCVTSFIARVNTLPTDENMKEIHRHYSMKETEALRDLFPALNGELISLNEKPLIVPQYFHSVNIDDTHVIYMEDMFKLGYRRIDPEIGFEKSHVRIIVKELARMHAISNVFMRENKISIESFKDRFQCTKNIYLDSLTDEQKFSLMIENYEYLKFVEHHVFFVNGWNGRSGHCINYLRNFIDETYEYTQLITPPFFSLTHGGVGAENFLFR